MPLTLCKGMPMRLRQRDARIERFGLCITYKYTQKIAQWAQGAVAGLNTYCSCSRSSHRTCTPISNWDVAFVTLATCAASQEMQLLLSTSRRRASINTTSIQECAFCVYSSTQKPRSGHYPWATSNLKLNSESRSGSNGSACKMSSSPSC